MKIFISYAKEDVEIAKRLYSDLRKAGFETWDEEDILPGEHISLFNKQIRDSSLVLLLFSVNSVSKRGEFVKQQKFVLKLLDEIPDSETFIIPVRLDDCDLPDERLQNFKAVDLFSSYEKGLEKILKALHRKKSDRKEASLVRQSEIDYEDRFLDAAMPEEVTINQETELLTMIRLPNSEGLRRILGADSQYQAQAKDIKSSESFPVKYPSDEKGNVLGIDLVIAVETNDFRFKNSESQKKIRVLQSTDSSTCTFLLTPIKTGELRVLIHVYYSESIIASGILKVNGGSSLDKNLIIIKKIITLSLGVFGVKTSDHGISNQDKPPKKADSNNAVNIGKDAEGNIIVSGDGNTIIISESDPPDKKYPIIQKPEPQKHSPISYAAISLTIVVIGILYFVLYKPFMEFVPVIGGEYTMGCITGDTECQDNEKPPHKVQVKSFMIGKYEVTQAQWQEIMGKNPNFECKDCPAIASRNDVQIFIRKLNEKTGKKYRLPTEAEWEFACRSGGKDDKYSGGNDLNPVGWYDMNSQDVIHPVGTKKPNALGIFDMSGNVWEWCEDVYCPNTYENKTCSQIAESDKNAENVIRGGSWQYSATNSRCTSRRGHSSVQTADDIGFRLVREDFSDAK